MAAWLWRGLAGVAAGGDPAPAWRSPWQRRAVYAGLTVVTMLLALVSLASLRGITSLISLLGANQQIVAGPPPAVWRGSRVDTPRGGKFSFVAVAHVAAQIHPVVWGVFAGPVGRTVLAVLLALAVVAPVALAGRYPLLGWRLAWVGLWAVPWAHVGWAWGWAWGPVLLTGVVVTLGIAGVRQPRPVLWWMAGLTVIPWVWREGSAGPGAVPCAAGVAGLLVVTVAADAMAGRRRAQLVLAGEAERAELEQARRAVLEERARIARELHDVVAHHLSLIAVRAESAPFRLAGLDPSAAGEFGSLSGAAREALGEMRRLLGVLRSDGPAARAPQPQLGDVPGLVAAARAAGVSVDLAAPAPWPAVPAGVGVCAYRIVQESLTNASRHAPGAPVTVSVGHDKRAVLLRVINGPPAPAAPAGGGSGPGQGLVGMRERVALLGGSLSAGPAPGGGFIVSATLPLHQAA
ncbi:MAG TPA: histidine kinase [Streptosporangiaceae bacterium]|nr:histidine kinase [Streptosporangiaceae bacterium]